MKITSVETFLMQAGPPGETAWSTHTGTAAGGMSMGGSRHWLFVRVETDSGLYGVGEGSGWPRVVAEGVRDLAPLVIGQDPRDIGRLWNRMFLGIMGHGITGTVGGGAIGAIEMALWDIKGKHLGVPVWDLLGGRVRDRVRVYAHASTPETARRFMDMGYRAFKTGNVRGVVEKVAALRQGLGDEIDLMVDLHGPPWLTIPDAIAMGRALEPYRLAFLEEPVPPENTDGYARIRDAVNIPLAAGERGVNNAFAAAGLLKKGLIDVIQPDSGRCGGIGQLQKIAHIAEGCFATIAPHAGTLGPVAETAALHVMATVSNALIMEQFAVDWPGRYEVVTTTPQVDNGFLIVPDTPGLGIDLNLDEIAKYPPGHNASVPNTGSYAAGTGDEFTYTQPRWSRVSAFGLETG